MESRSSESRSSYTPSSSYNYSSSSESRSSESREVSSISKQTNNYDSSESRESSESRQSNERFIPASEYTDRMIKVPASATISSNDSIYITYRGERIVIKKGEVEAFKVKLTYPEDYETLLDILEQTAPSISHTSPEITEELQKREIMINELRQRVIAQKARESLVKGNEELNKILGLSK